MFAIELEEDVAALQARFLGGTVCVDFVEFDTVLAVDDSDAKLAAAAAKYG